MQTINKYLPHLGIIALIVFLAADYFSPEKKPISFDSEKSVNIEEVENLSQKKRERRMAVFHYNEGNKLYKEENYLEASIQFEKALHHNKKFREALINLSTTYIKTKVFDKALKILQSGQKQFPQEPLFDYNFACYYSLNENVGLGLSALKQAVEKGFKQFKQLENDADLWNLRQTEEYKMWKKRYPL